MTDKDIESKMDSLLEKYKDVFLRDCPFCGKKPKLSWYWSDYDGGDTDFMIKCKNCGCKLHDDEVDDLIDTWNGKKIGQHVFTW